MTDNEYFMQALHRFNTDQRNWYSWKTHDDDGNKIPGKDRMQYQYIKVVVEGATIPSEADVNAKMKELKDANEAKEKTKTDNKTSGKAKLKAGEVLTNAEISALFGD